MISLNKSLIQSLESKNFVNEYKKIIHREFS